MISLLLVREELLMRVKNHPILKFEDKQEISFEFEGEEVIGYQGDSIASALIDNGVKTFGYSIKYHRPRGFYCAIGNCASCNMEVDGQPNVRTCLTALKPGMKVYIQRNKGEIK
jgi:predicted molibdopterin-dependent oxidoreductase YjgC